MSESAFKQAFNTHPRTNTLLNLGEAALTWSRSKMDFAFYVLSRLKKGALYASQASLAQHLSIHEDTAGKYLREFKEIGIITITKRDYTTNVYELTKPFSSDVMTGILFTTLKELSNAIIKPIYLLSNQTKAITIQRVTGLLNKILIRINTLIRALAYKGLIKKIKRALGTRTPEQITNEQVHKLLSTFRDDVLLEALKQCNSTKIYISFNFIFFKCLQFCKELRIKPTFWKYIQRSTKKGFQMLKQYEAMQAKIRKENRLIDKERKYQYQKDRPLGYQKPDMKGGNAEGSYRKYTPTPVTKTDPCELYHKASHAMNNILNFFQRERLRDTVISLKKEHDELVLLGKCQDCPLPF